MSRASRLTKTFLAAGLGAAVRLAACAFATGAAPAMAQIRVVNMIPASLSGETGKDAEPNVSAHPGSPNYLVGSTANAGGTFCPSTSRALFVSIDLGETWTLACTLHVAASKYAGDLTVRFSGDGNAVFASYLVKRAIPGVYWDYDAKIIGMHKPSAALPSDLTTALAGGASLLTWTSLGSGPQSDQPYVMTLPGGGANIAVAMVNRDLAMAGSPTPCAGAGAVLHTATPFLMPPTTMRAACVAARAGQFSWSTRTALGSDGTMYAVTMRPVMSPADGFDLVLSRWDPLAAPAFGQLRDDAALSAGTPAPAMGSVCPAPDNLVGKRMVICQHYPFHYFPSADFGQERRVGSQLSIAVDPSNSSKVFVAWADSVEGSSSHLTVHLAVSTDRGVTWNFSTPIPNATNPALAVAGDGAIGLLFQQLFTNPIGQRWWTLFRLYPTAASMWVPSTGTVVTTTLSDVPVSPPCPDGMPFMGDYIHLESRGNSFYGIFSTSNDRVNGRFIPNSSFQRSYNDFGELIDLGGYQIKNSIDPYFVKVVRP